MRTEAELNWDVLRTIIVRDAERSQELADSSEWGEMTKAKLAGRAEAFRRVLDSMCTLEYGAEVTLSFPIDTVITAELLAEHTAAAQDKIIEAAQTSSPLLSSTVPAPGRDKLDEFKDCSCGERIYKGMNGHWYHWVNGLPVPAAACDTITKAATS